VTGRLHTGIANAGSEGTNRVIKTVARNAFGFRNPKTSASAPAPRPLAATADTSAPLNFEEPTRHDHHRQNRKIKHSKWASRTHGRRPRPEPAGSRPAP
jgi:hypothetical protein